jgi:hypothetical protein
LMEAEFENILEANNGIPPLAILKDQGSDQRQLRLTVSDNYF